MRRAGAENSRPQLWPVQPCRRAELASSTRSTQSGPVTIGACHANRTNFIWFDANSQPTLLCIGRVEAGQSKHCNGPPRQRQTILGKEKQWPQSQGLVIGRELGGGNRQRINGLPGWLVGLAGCSTRSTSPCFF